MLERGAILRLANALHAEGALLHDTLAAHRHVRIELPVQRLGERILPAANLTIPEPVEVADLVRAVVRAIARADAPVVDLDVQTVRRVVRRVHRADRLARRVATMLAHHRDEARLEVRAAVLAALVVPLETDPGHLATLQNVRAWPRVPRTGGRRRRA